MYWQQARHRCRPVKREAQRSCLGGLALCALGLTGHKLAATESPGGVKTSGAFVLTSTLSAKTVNSDALKLARCPPEGDAVQAEARALNPLKRRMAVPTTRDIDPKVTLKAMLAPGDDTDRWSQQKAATITGYVTDVKVGGIESVNCHTHTPLYRDTHIEITAGGSPDEPLIVEVTPQWRPQHPDWTTSILHHRLVGHWVRFTGWLMFDAEHAAESRNTCTRCTHVWRQTSWELHPIVAIEVLEKAP